MNLAQFFPDYAAIAKLQLQPEMIARFKEFAEAAAEEARAIAPVGFTGNYRDSIEGDAYIEDGALVARVNAFDYKAWWIEVGTEDTPTFATLRLGAEAAGFHVEAEVGRGRT